MSSRHDDWNEDERQALAALKSQLDDIRRRHAADPSLELLLAARADLLPGDLQQKVATHLDQSAWSRALVDGLAVSSGEPTLDSVTERRLWARISRPAPEQRVDAAKTAAWWKYGAAAVAASLLMAVMVARQGGTPATDAPRGPEAVATTPNPPGPSPLALTFTKPDVILSPAALTWRSGSTDNPFLTDLQPAIEAYRSGAYADADARFTALADRYPRAIEVLFFHGIVRMLRDDFAGAAPLLTAAVEAQEPTFAEDAAWYLAVAEQRAGRNAEALRRIAGLCAGGGTRASDACGAEKLLRASQTSPRP